MYGNPFFFFQAEDGIRDGRVTGVQTCALPISLHGVALLPLNVVAREVGVGAHDDRVAEPRRVEVGRRPWQDDPVGEQIGRASCRERGEISGGGGSLKKKKG